MCGHEIHWNPQGNLEFTFCRKDGQQLKHLDSDITHLPHCFRAITSGALQRLANLTTKNEQSNSKSMRDSHPDHLKALNKAARTDPKDIPTLQQVLSKIGVAKKEEKKKKTRDDEPNRNVCFCIGYSTFWDEPIHKTLKALRNKHNLKWL
jgi:hypothetical protein